MPFWNRITFKIFLVGTYTASKIQKVNKCLKIELLIALRDLEPQNNNK